MTKRIFLLLFALLSFGPAHTQTHTSCKYQILLTGASFASPENTWFEMACRTLNVCPVNRAVGAESIVSTVNRMINGTLYSIAEFDNIDALVIMQVHNKDVFDESELLKDYKDYSASLIRSNYAVAFDYVIKRYISECYRLRNNPDSKYYKTQMGKPAVIVLCTDWHDARVIYNTSVRKLAEKWGFPVVEFDQYIGFSKNSVHPVTGEQHSLIYANDTQTIDGVKYGWHPRQGENSYVQQRMAAIFVDLMQRILPMK